MAGVLISNHHDIVSFRKDNLNRLISFKRIVNPFHIFKRA